MQEEVRRCLFETNLENSFIAQIFIILEVY